MQHLHGNTLDERLARFRRQEFVLRELLNPYALPVPHRIGQEREVPAPDFDREPAHREANPPPDATVIGDVLEKMIAHRVRRGPDPPAQLESVLLTVLRGKRLVDFAGPGTRDDQGDGRGGRGAGAGDRRGTEPRAKLAVVVFGHCYRSLPWSSPPR